MENSNSCLIYHNTFEDSNYDTVFLNSDTNNNILHHNKFINNNGGHLFKQGTMELAIFGMKKQLKKEIIGIIGQIQKQLYQF